LRVHYHPFPDYKATLNGFNCKIIFKKIRKKGIENKKVRLMMFLTELIYFCKRKLDLLKVYIGNGWILLEKLGMKTNYRSF